MKAFKSNLSSQIGEHLVVSELGRRGILATTFSGNVPDIDILAYANGKSCALQVKAWKKGEVSLDAKKFLSISFKEDFQFVDGINPEIDPELIYVFVRIDEKREDRFYIVTQGFIQKAIEEGYRSWLAKKGNRRPRNPKTTHTAIGEEDLKPFAGRWDLIEERLGLKTAPS